MIANNTLPGFPENEKQRRKLWLNIPRRARIAIRRLHRNFRRLPKNALVQMLRAAKAPNIYIDAAKAFRCDACAANQPKPQTHKVSRPHRYIFGHEVGIDVFEIRDAAGKYYDILNAVDMGTTFDQAWIVRVGDTHGSPSSGACLKAFDQGWVRWAGWPKYIACDRGVHNRGVFARTISGSSVIVRPAGLESPEQIGRVERRNEILNP